MKVHWKIWVVGMAVALLVGGFVCGALYSPDAVLAENRSGSSTLSDSVIQSAHKEFLVLKEIAGELKRQGSTLSKIEANTQATASKLSPYNGQPHF